MTELRKTPYTRKELFELVWEMVKENDETITDFIDYALPAGQTDELRTYEFRFDARLDHGSEGIYLDIFICIWDEEKRSEDRYKFGTVKTLEDDDVAFEKMGAIFGRFMACMNQFVRKNSINFEFTDCTVVRPCREDGTEIYGRYCYSKEEYEKFVEENRERYPKLNVYDLKERKTYIV